MNALQFDVRNAADYAEITARIDDATREIEQGKNQPATRANLARLSGVHRNTLYKRALTGSEDGDTEKGWPFSALSTIVQQRKKTVDADAKVAAGSTLEKELEDLQRRLEKSRYVAAGWFRRSIELKQERNEARRHVELLLQQTAVLKREVDDVRQKLKNQIGVPK